MFSIIKNKATKVFNLNIDDIFHEFFYDKDFCALIKRLNTEGEQTSQLIYGINSKDETLDSIGGEYSPYTIMLKKDKGQITDHVTLKDTGEFYNSFQVFWTGTGIKITADTIKEGGENLITRWGKEIIGLNDTNLGILIEYIKPKLKQIVLKKIAA